MTTEENQELLHKQLRELRQMLSVDGAGGIKLAQKAVMQLGFPKGFNPKWSAMDYELISVFAILGASLYLVTYEGEKP